MLDVVRSLLVLQDRDRRVLQIGKDLAQLPREEERAKNKLAGDKAAVQAAHDKIVENDLQLKRLELDAETRHTTIKRLKSQQFETRKNDEFQALGHEITRYEEEIDGLETQELELMEELDQLRASHKSAEEALAKTQNVVDHDIASIKQRGGQLESDLVEIRAEREKLAGEIDEEVIKLYDRLMKSKDGYAVVRLEEEQCGGCHMKVIASTKVAVHQQAELTRCENCGRILYAEG